MNYKLALITALFAVTELLGSVDLLFGIEGPAREPEYNKTQEWFGLQWTSQEPLLGPFHIYTKGLTGNNASSDFLISMGILYTWYPVEENTDFTISLLTGPSYTEVGWPHTGTDINWSSDLRLEYKGFFMGYSHTSNGGFGRPNSGLDMILLGYSFSWNQQSR